MNEHIFQVIIDAFIVVVAVAVERFLTHYPVGTYDTAFKALPGQTSKEPMDPCHPDNAPPVRDVWYWICYTLSLIIIVTLVLRFLIGSYTQLTGAYRGKSERCLIEWFITDICFLMFFGAFIVGAAMSKSVRGFMLWLALTSAIGVIWSSVAVVFRHEELACWWLAVNSIQAMITGALFFWCSRLGKQPGEGRIAVRFVLSVGAVWFMVIFPWDLIHILEQASQKLVEAPGH